MNALFLELYARWPELADALLQGAILVLPVALIVAGVWAMARLGQRLIDHLEPGNATAPMRTADARQIERDVERLQQAWQPWHDTVPPAEQPRPHVRSGAAQVLPFPSPSSERRTRALFVPPGGEARR